MSEKIKKREAVLPSEVYTAEGSASKKQTQEELAKPELERSEAKLRFDKILESEGEVREAAN